MSTDLLREAMAAHQGNRFDEAEALYRRRLHERPDDADAWHLQGVLQAQRGRHAEAEQSIASAIALRPAEAMFHNNLGNVCIERDRRDEAEAHYRRAVELDGRRLDAVNNLAVLLGRGGRVEEAERLLRHVIDNAPEFGDARQNLANLYLRAGRHAEAVQQCAEALVVAPRHPALRRLLGQAYALGGRLDQAAEVYRQWLAVEPDDPVARHHLQAITGEAVPERAGNAYVQHVFDGFARSFDAKLAELSYRAPEFVAEALGTLVGAPRRALQILDAGCGTGLCGPLLAPYAERLAGVDLSDGMLQRARVRQVYDTLEQAELVAFLSGRADAFDAIVSADTLCYFGRLEGFAAAAARALRAGGVLVFTVEAHADADDAPPYRLHAHGRYSHRRRYIEGTLQQARLEVAVLQAVVLRQEAGEPVEGWLVGARRGSPR
jgi:predicted TPR repeat methyltransferase